MNGNNGNWTGEGFENMLFDYLDNGYLENIITFFEHEPNEMRLIPKMLQDERIRIRVGALAIIESLKEKYPDRLKDIVPLILNILLKAKEKNIRGDAAYALEIIADPSTKKALEEALSQEEDEQVREFIQDAINKLS
ncbi:HEAT repeat domain-containing protein [Thermodesulfovibrio hydrogeniphilus]